MFTQMYNTLSKHPVIGFISGIISTICLKLNSFFTDEVALKLISGIGVWAGTLVAVLSAIIYFFKLCDIVRNRYKRWKNPPAVVLAIVILSVLLTSCGARHVALQSTHNEMHKDSSGSSASSVQASQYGFIVGDQAGSLKNNRTFTQTSTDTGTVSQTIKTVIWAKFAPGTGPTPGQVAAAAGDSAKTGSLLAHATDLTITSNGSTFTKKGLGTTGKQTFEFSADTQSHSTIVFQKTVDSTGNSKAKVTQSTVSDSKSKQTDRKGISAPVALAIAGGVIVLLIILGIYINRKLKL